MKHPYVKPPAPAEEDPEYVVNQCEARIAKRFPPREEVDSEGEGESDEDAPSYWDTHELNDRRARSSSPSATGTHHVTES